MHVFWPAYESLSTGAVIDAAQSAADAENTLTA